MAQTTAYGTIRTALLALIHVGILGLGAELFLLEHTESVWQWIPLAVLAGGFISGLVVTVKPTARAVRVFQAAMVLCIAAGLLGLYLHFQGNAEFELEMEPSLGGVALLWKSLRGATPALAPGAMVQLGLLGLLFSYRHPATHPMEKT